MGRVNGTCMPSSKVLRWQRERSSLLILVAWGVCLEDGAVVVCAPVKDSILSKQKGTQGAAQY